MRPFEILQKTKLLINFQGVTPKHQNSGKTAATFEARVQFENASGFRVS